MGLGFAKMDTVEDSEGTGALQADYNVTCPANRFCQIKHKYQSPCPFWDCSPCWWNHDNCTKTDEAPSFNCPYVTCESLPQPGGHSTVTILSVLAGISFLVLFVVFLVRRLRARGSAEADLEASATEGETIPLLQRCQALLRNQPPALLRHFRDVIFGARDNPAPPEHPGDQLQPFLDAQREEDDPRPSAPPPPYEEVENPIIRRQNESAGILNQNYGSMGNTTSSGPSTSHTAQDSREVEMTVRQPRERQVSGDRSAQRMDEILLSS